MDEKLVHACLYANEHSVCCITGVNEVRAAQMSRSLWHVPI